MVIIRRPTTRTATTNQGTATSISAGANGVSPYVVNQRSLSRTAELLGAVLAIDTSTDERTRRDLMAFVESLYPPVPGGVPVGLFATCHLGGSYLDHIVDLNGGIVEHFTDRQALPDPYAAARPLARNPAYLFVEVYSDGQVIPIRPDGSPVT